MSKTRAELAQEICNVNWDFFCNTFDPIAVTLEMIDQHPKLYPKAVLEEMLMEAKNGAVTTKTNQLNRIRQRLQLK